MYMYIWNIYSNQSNKLVDINSDVKNFLKKIPTMLMVMEEKGPGVSFGGEGRKEEDFLSSLAGFK